jgi:hypothetical protein
LVGGRGVEPGTGSIDAIDDDGTGACVVEGGTVGIGEIEVAAVEVRRPGEAVASGFGPVAAGGAGAVITFAALGILGLKKKKKEGE